MIAILLPGLSPNILYKNNLVKIDTSIENTLEKSIIDDKAKDWDGESDFGNFIRE